MFAKRAKQHSFLKFLLVLHRVDPLLSAVVELVAELGRVANSRVHVALRGEHRNS